jgi:ectoine hydroxylase-related dioxygenase (phytanoyl-CoA dioxygenase family)
MALCNDVLGHDLRISFTSAIINEPNNKRGHWHADWPFNQNNAGHVPAPYPDATFHITTLWMLSPFTIKNGGTLIVPGSHRSNNNPTGNNGIDSHAQILGEMNVTGPAGSVLVMDSRLWHATAPNTTPEPRVALAIRYAPWWLNLDILMPESNERNHMVHQQNKKGSSRNSVVIKK